MFSDRKRDEENRDPWFEGYLGSGKWKIRLVRETMCELIFFIQIAEIIVFSNKIIIYNENQKTVEKEDAIK